MLVLLDIDGTLLLGRPRAHQTALVSALRTVARLPVETDDLVAVEPSGRTDRQIIRLVMERHGAGPPDIRRALPEIMSRAVAEHARAAEGVEDQRLAPFARAALERLAADGMTLVPLTGNIAGIARRKLERAGLDDLVDASAGAFGSDAEDRSALVAIARGRAGFPDGTGVVVGDTPRDVAAAKDGGARCIAVTTSGRTPDELAGADHVASDLAEAADTILRWR